MTELNLSTASSLLSLLVSTGIGLILGLEREFRKTNDSDHFAGIRTFPLVSILGYLIAFAGRELGVWLVVAGLVGFILLVATTYVMRSAKGHKGITTEISLIITFVLGALTAHQMIKEALAATVITTTLLTLKGKFHSFILKITEEELFAFVKFIILCMLLLPFLPNVDYGPGGILNPQEIGIIVVVVSALSFIAYVLIKFTGPDKGILVTAILGGLFSSTAVTWMFASRSKNADITRATLYAAGIILASAIMFVRVALVTLIFNRDVFFSLIKPCALMFLSGVIYAITLAHKKPAPIKDTPPVELGNPVNILNALAFGLLYVGISLFVYYGSKYFGTKGLILSGLISGLADVDAVTINLSKFADKGYAVNLSVIAILMASVGNTLVKMLITVIKGSGIARTNVALSLGITVLAGLTYLLIFRP